VRRIKHRLPEIVAVTLLGCTLAAAAALAAGTTPALVPWAPGGVELGVRLDVLPTVLMGFIASLGLLVAVYSRRNLEGQSRRLRFDIALSGALVALVLMVTGASLPAIALGWTVSGLATVALVAHADGPRARRASRFVARCLLAGDIALWAGVIVAMSVLPTVNRAELGDADLSTGAATAVTVLLVVAGIARSGLYPVDRWLPETAEAPSPVSAMLHAGVINGAGVMAALMWPLFVAAPAALMVLLAAGIASVIVGTWGAMVRRDIKGRLACSTTAQMGYMSIQAALGLPAAAVLHLIGHGYYKSWSFLRAGGAVARSRTGLAPVPAARGGVIAAAVLALVAGTALALVPLVASVDALGPTAVVPIAAALAAGAVLAGVGARTRATGAGAATWIALGAVAPAVYAWMLVGWEYLLAPSLPLEAAWGMWAAIALVVIVALAAVAAVAGAVAVARHPHRVLARVVAMRTLPPWVRHRRRTWQAPQADAEARGALVDAAEAVAAPAWPLRAFVASSALANMAHLPFPEAIARSGHAMPSAAQAVAALDAGRVTRDHLRAALGDAGRHDAGDAEVDALIARARAAAAAQAPAAAAAEGSAEEASLWCQRAWGYVDDDGNDPWSLFRASFPADGLPEDPAEGLARAHAAAGGPDPGRYVRALAAISPGWSAHAAWRARETDSTDPMLQLLALRAVLCGLRGEDPLPAADARGADGDWAIWLEAMEAAQRAPLADALARAAADAGATRPAGAGDGGVQAQVMFCIDVRSEPMRRAIEASGEVETFGVAGFFGLPLRVRQARGAQFDQCPALLRPSYDVPLGEGSATALPHARTRGITAARAPLAQLVAAEAIGVAAGIASLLQMAAPRAWAALGRRWGAIPAPWPQPPAHAPWGDVPPKDRLEAADGLLRSIGLVSGFAPLLVVCGHAASAENNAYATAYDCGACGGNGGQVNARALAAILNDAGVRRGLADRGILIPDSTVAVAAVHDTTRQVIELEEAPTAGPAGTAADRFAVAVEAARATVLAITLPRLPGAPNPADGPAALVRHVERRARDWSQAFPEWGLAGNAFFIVAPREFTRHLDLGGRAFLHSYDPETDPDLAALELILTAPAVVAHWISMQYALSSVAPQHLGAGDKTTHNVVGDVGVLSGAHGDLRQGLPWQALFARDPRVDAGSCVHDPLRLLVAVAAPEEAVEEVLRRNPDLAAMIDGGWMALALIDPQAGLLRRRVAGAWQPWPGGDDRPAMASGAVSPVI
jgi:NADH:ubiquinone oxidoreductase subunit 5 (subunit L)/multisubunit Na+/H+ antiporter MnhA subunit